MQTAEVIPLEGVRAPLPRTMRAIARAEARVRAMQSEAETERMEMLRLSLMFEQHIRELSYALYFLGKPRRRP